MSIDQVTVVVPTYNERDNIRHIAAAVLLHGYSLLIVDDNSPDGTGDIADELADQIGSVDVLHRPEKGGIGPAYIAGFEAALTRGADVIIEMDADFSHNPEDLPRLVEEIADGADLVIGSRYVPGGSTPDWPALRQFISKSGNFYARHMLGIGIGDATAGYRAYSAAALNRLPYQEAQASGYGFQVEMAWRAVAAGLNVREIPIVFRDRELGTSKMGTPIVIEAMWLVTKWGIARRLVRR